MDQAFKTVSLSLLLLVTTALGRAEENIIECEFKVFGVGSDHYKGLYYSDGKEYSRLNFQKARRSRSSYRYKGPETFSVYVKNPDYQPANPESLEYLPVAKTLLEESKSELLLVFAANKENRTADDAGRRFKIFPLNDDLNYFARNHIILLNTTGIKLYGQVGGRKVVLSSGFTEPIPYDSSKGTTLSFAVKTEKGPRLVLSNKLELPNNRRVLLVLESPGKSGSMRLSARMLSESIFEEDENR